MKLENIISSNKQFLVRKYVFEKDGKNVESVFVDRGNKNIICLSSMFGCPVRCKFCASGTNYFGKLSRNDILDMVYEIIEEEDIDYDKKLLISFMGSGEPLMNIISVRDSIKKLSEKIPGTYFALSFSGARIDNLSLLDGVDNSKIKLQFSLHSPYDSERKAMIPLTDDLGKILYLLSNSPFDLEINYCLMNDVNDSVRHALDLSELIKQHNFKLKINEYHDVGNNFKTSRNNESFFEVLKNKGVDFEYYSTDGVEIGAACGQLKSKKIK
jgi:23S rRNA (adenine2503-C2)-methyltransferase